MLWLQIEYDLRILSGSQHFFPFEEVLRSVLLAFSRDPAIGSNCSIPSENYIPIGTLEGDVHYPPSRVLPFKGLVLLAAPLCMIYNDPADVFVVSNPSPFITHILTQELVLFSQYSIYLFSIV